MGPTQYTTPLLLRGDRVIRLKRVPFDQSGFSEDWLQDLLYRNPTLLPVRDLETLFDGLIPLARELPTASGPIDLVMVNQNGYLTLVETKLWRNPEARRTVVAQIVDYAKDMSKWSYEDLEAAVAAVRPDVAADGGIVELVATSAGVDDDFDEAAFIDSVSRNLERGRFLLLIVGDGIREGVRQMTEFLQQMPQLGYTLALSEIGVFRTDVEVGEELFIQPRILARTQEIVRAVVEINIPIAPSAVSVSLPPEPEKKVQSPRRQPITEEKFFEELRGNAPEVVDFAEWVLENAEETGLSIKWGGGGPLIQYVDDSTGVFFTLGQLNKHGHLDSLWSLPGRCKGLGLPDRVWLDYWAGLQHLIPGSCPVEFQNRKGELGLEFVYGSNPTRNSRPPLAPLAERRDEWFRLMQATVERIREALNELDEA